MPGYFLALLILHSSFGSLFAGGKAIRELTQPLPKVDALNLALANNGIIRQARKDVEAAAGIAIQIRAILYPTVAVGATYAVRQDSLIEANRDRTIPPVQVEAPAVPALGLPAQMFSIGGGESPKVKNQYWIGDIRVVQSIYEGGE